MSNVKEHECKLPKRYQYEARQISQFGGWLYLYEIVGEHGAVHLHLRKYKEHEWSGGVEIYYATRPEYMEPQPPHYMQCPLLKRPCWHDGSSLAADDYVYAHNCGDTEGIFLRLVAVADDRFGGGSEHKTAIEKLAEAANAPH